jgi:hypothetical protein
LYPTDKAFTRFSKAFYHSDKQLESLESDIRKLNVELDKKDDIIYSHKQHNNQDHNAGNWSQLLHIIQDHTRENAGIWSQVQYKNLDINESKTPQNKPEILLIGTSSTKGIQSENNSSSYVLRKKEAMTLADTEKKVNEIRDAPSVLVLHSLTNWMPFVLDVSMINISGLFCGVFDSLMSRFLYCTCDQIPAAP